MKLYLGAGQKRLAGYTHVDIVAGEGIDVVHDLNERLGQNVSALHRAKVADHFAWHPRSAEYPCVAGAKEANLNKFRRAASLANQRM